MNSIADSLSAIQEQLGAILSDFPEGMDDIRQLIVSDRRAVEDSCLSVRKIGRTLQEIIEIYSSAERKILSEINQTGLQPSATSGATPVVSARAPFTTPQKLSPPIIRKSHRLLFTSDVVIPDWLQAALTRYEQARLGTRGQGSGISD